MKKISIIAVSLFTAFINSGNLHAQTAINLAVFNTDDSMNKGINTATAPAAAEATAAINKKAIASFNRQYKGAAGVEWTAIADGYTAEFKEEGNLKVVYYNQKGYWAGYRKIYLLDHIPAEIRNMIKAGYRNYDLNMVTEFQAVGSNGIPTYIAAIEDRDSIIWLRIYEGEMEEYKTFPKH